MSWEVWATFFVLVIMVTAMIRNIAGPDVIMWGGLTLLMALGVFSDKFPTPSEMVAGFGNEGLVTVAVLFVVVEGLSMTGAMGMATHMLLGRPKNVVVAQARLMFPVAGLSAFLNNTPIVAMFLPVVSDLSKKTGISPSKLFIPLSYATVLGGLCTLIGTSTNLVVHGLLKAQGSEGIGMFDLAWVGLPAAAVGLTYIMVVTPWLLPARKPAISYADNPREFTVEMMVEPGSPLVGQTIEQAGLRHLPGMYLIEIERGGSVIAAVSPQERLQADDRLVFAGVVESVIDLRKIRGLVPATNQVFKLDSNPRHRCLIEAVVSSSCPVVGKTIRDGRFRTNYNAVVIAVARNGRRVAGKIGDIVLQTGDTLLLEAHPSFVEQQHNSRDFFLVSRLEGSAPPRHHRSWLAMGILAAMVAAMGFEWVSPLVAAMVAAAAMILTRCCTASEARRSVDWQVLIVIGAALGISQAMLKTGTASAIANGLVGTLGGGNAWVSLAVIYAVTMLFTELASNNAAAAMMFPIAWSAAQNLHVSPTPFAMAMTIAASCGFATPIGYQTHLMVYGPGGYRFSDYLKIGIPLNFLVMAIVVAIAPFVWPF